MSLSANEVVAALLPKLRSESVVYFPVRHHSPACALHLTRWIEKHQPRSVLVEGPESFNPLIPLLIDPRCVCPVAIYTNFIDRQLRLQSEDGDADDAEPPPPRFAAFYPFADYSPELVALRAGHTAGARLRFIDLGYAESVLAEADAEQSQPQSLAGDAHLAHSRYIQSLTRRLGLRDFNEVWDHLFEAHADAIETDDFIDQVATYCSLARQSYSPEDLVRDGTTAREACMAAAICEELERGDESVERTVGRTSSPSEMRSEESKSSEVGGGSSIPPLPPLLKGGSLVRPIFVVTGGFHTAALPDLVAQGVTRPARVAFRDGEVGAWLIRYSFDQLDALAGYSSGMPSPEFYNRLWHATSGVNDLAERRRRLDGVAAEVVVKIGRLTREKRLPTALSTPDCIAALHAARQLAQLRGHPWPLREDVLDGMRSCFVKGEMEGDGAVLMNLVRQTLAGNRIGQVPPEAGILPIVADFDREARRLKLPVEAVESKELSLDLYRNPRDRQISRFLHRLDLLRVPFAVYTGGPDFVAGSGLDQMYEHWTVRWSPTTESGLIAAAVNGTTVADAALYLLLREVVQLQDQGQGRSTTAAVTSLIRACRLGLHDFCGLLVEIIHETISEDPEFVSLVTGLSQLDLLRQALEPLEATHLENLPRLLVAAWRRGCQLLNDVAGCPDELVTGIVNSLKALREISRGLDSVPDTELDLDLFHHGLERVIAHPPASAQPAVVGAAAGVLIGIGRLSSADLLTLVCGYLRTPSIGDRKSVAILHGLLSTAREIAWQLSEFLQAIDALMSDWDEQEFLQALPDLRLAFSDLTPREIDRVAEAAAGLHGKAELGTLVNTTLDESDLLMGLEINRIVRETLEADGLSHGIATNFTQNGIGTDTGSPTGFSSPVS